MATASPNRLTSYATSGKEQFETVNGHQVWTYTWDQVQGDVKAVLHICHGMQELCARYEQMATALNKYGIVVYGHDHLGHGLTNDMEKSKTRGYVDYP